MTLKFSLNMDEFLMAKFEQRGCAADMFKIYMHNDADVFLRADGKIESMWLKDADAIISQEAIMAKNGWKYLVFEGYCNSREVVKSGYADSLEEAKAKAQEFRDGRPE